MVADEQQDNIGVQAQALQKIEGNRLLDAPALAVLLDGPEIALLALANNGIVQSSECGALCAAIFNLVLPGRLAPLMRTEKKLCHRRWPFLPGDFFHTTVRAPGECCTKPAASKTKCNTPYCKVLPCQKIILT